MNVIRKIEIEQEEKNKMLKMYNEDKMSLQKIANTTGFSIATVHRILTEMNYIPRNNREQALKYAFNENYFENIDCEHKAYWLGYICADATIYNQTKTDSGILKFEMKKQDEELIFKFKEDIHSNHPIKYYTNKHFKGYRSARLVLRSNEMVQDLAKYGVTANKSLVLNFPEQLISNQYVGAFIRGYFDGDGSLCLYSNEVFDIKIIGTENFLNTIKDVIQIKCRISNPKSKAYELRISSNEERKKFLIFIYKNATVYLQRKYDRFQLFLQKH